jgi:polar amino acid transport system substrate-binding protein
MNPQNTHRSNIIFYVCLFLSLATSWVHAAPGRTLIINNTNEAPLTTDSRDGFVDIIATEAFRRAGANLDLVKLPAERGLLSANDGLVDGDLTRITGLEKLYPNLVRVEEKLVDWEFVAYSKNPDMRSELQSIRMRVVGHITGWKIYEQALEGAPQVVSINGPEQLFHLLDRDRIEVALYARWMGQAHIKRLGLDGIVQLSPPLAVREMFIYLHRDHVELAGKIANALRELKREGFYQRVMDEKLRPYQANGN